MIRAVKTTLLIIAGLVCLLALPQGGSAGRAWSVPADRPVITPLASQEVAYGEALTFKVEAQDPTGQPVFYDAANLPEGAVLQPRSGLFSWRPTINQLGNYRITFAAWDRLSPQRMANASAVCRVVYRKVSRAKGWGLGVGAEKILIETTDVADLYPTVTGLSIDGQDQALTREVFPAAAGSRIKVRVASYFKIDRRSAAVFLDGAALKTVKLEAVETYGAGQVVGFVLDFALPVLTPGEHLLQIKTGNELGGNAQDFVLVVAQKAVQ